MNGIRRHLPELAVEWALDQPGRLWQAIDGTLCFADISGFTALSEKLSRRGRIGGEELVETLSRVFGGMLDSARERDGMLLKFGGDALLFLFKGPGHALRAASTAVEMREALRRAREIPTSVGPLNLSMSVGLHSGVIHFFLVGSTHRELVLAGPDASLAAATESAANAGEIGVSPATAALLPSGAVRPRDDGLLLLRWRKAPGGPEGASPLRPAGEELLHALFPRALGTVLARGRPDPEHRVACIAFVKFSGTDQLLERDGPDAVAAALQDTLSVAMDLFAEEEVTLLAVDIDKDGGKLFLGSGVPQASEDDEGRMLRALTRLVATPTPLPLQAGVNRGHVFAAEVGTPRRAAYSAMGDTTNTAARICAKAPPGAVYAHPSVLEHSRVKYATEAAGPFTFKGKKLPQLLYRVGEETGAAAVPANADLPLCGRRDELRALNEVVDAWSSGIGGVATITGEAGLGKSRLLRESLQPVASLQARQLDLRAELYGTNSPYRVFRDPLRSLLGLGRADNATLRTQLQAAVTRLDESLLPQLALLGEVVHVDVEPSPEVAAIEPRFRQDRIADAVTRLLRSIGDEPWIIVMEDAQWADGASSQLLQRLAGTCLRRPWLMLVTRRGDQDGFVPAAGTKVELGPLPAEDLAELVNAATASAPLRPHELQLVVRRASGNPLFAEEIVHAARRMGSFEAVPDSLEAAIAAQVDALDPDARRVLRYASVLGRSFGRRSLDGLLASEGLAIDGALLSRLEGFLEPDDEERLRFRVGLLRKTVYEGLAFRLRTRLHREAGEAMERLAPDPLAVADNLAMHFSLAGDQQRAWRYARAAADRAARAYANIDAARLYRIALDAARRLPEVPAAERADAWRRRGEACRLAGLFDDALQSYREAARLTGDAAIQADLALQRARARERKGEFSAALRELSGGRRRLAGLDDDAAHGMRARLAAHAAMIRFGQEKFDAALRQADLAAAEARAAGDKLALAQALVAADSAHLSLGGSGAERMPEALAIYEELGDLSAAAMVRGNLGCGAFLEGRWEEALAWFRGDREARLKAGNVVGAATAASNIGEILVKRGRLDEARPVLDEVVRVMRASGFHDGAAYAELQIGRLLLKRGDAARAAELLGRVAAEFAELGQPASALEAACVQALALLGLGRAADALQRLDEAVAAAGKSARSLAPQVAEPRARALLALGRPDEAQVILASGLAAAAKYAMPFEEALLRQVRIDAARQAGQAPDPEDLDAVERIMKGLGVQ